MALGEYFMRRCRALGACLQFSRWGTDLRSKRLLFYVAIIASVYPARRKRLMRHMEAALVNAAHDEVITVSVRSAWKGQKRPPVRVSFRLGNRADYQSIWECLSGEIYPIPDRPICHVLDGGSNLGFFIISLARLPVIPDVLAVEPSPDNLRLLRQNLSHLAGEVVVPAALSGSNGEARFEFADSNTGHLHGAVGHAASEQGTRVQCRRLIDLLPKKWDLRRTWVKLDIEGAEYDVLQDLLKSELRPAALSIEIHGYSSGGGERLLAQLREAGYQIQVMDPGSQLNTCRQVTALYNRTLTPQHDRPREFTSDTSA